MESNLLIQASSGLQKLMTGSKNSLIKDSLVAQISAYAYYNSEIMSGLMSHTGFKKQFNNTIFKQIEEDFGNYVDAKARSSQRSLHHVYEWNRNGDKEARLFKINKTDKEQISFTISYKFLPSKSFAKNEGKRKHVFINKAAVMEQGLLLKIFPKYAERLVFEVNGYKVFMPKGKSVTVNRPGGAGVKNSFVMTYSHFFKGNLVNESIKRSGFQNIFRSSMAKALALPSDIKVVKYSFKPNTIRAQAQMSLSSAFGV